MMIEERLRDVVDSVDQRSVARPWSEVEARSNAIRRREQRAQRAIVGVALAGFAFALSRGLAYQRGLAPADALSPPVDAAAESGAFGRLAGGLLPWLLVVGPVVVVWLASPRPMRTPWLAWRSSRVVRALVCGTLIASVSQLGLLVAKSAGVWSVWFGAGVAHASWTIASLTMILVFVLPVRELRDSQFATTALLALAALFGVGLAQTVTTEALRPDASAGVLVTGVGALFAILAVGVWLAARFGWRLEWDLVGRIRDLTVRRRAACFGGIVAVLLMTSGAVLGAITVNAMHEVTERSDPPVVDVPRLTLLGDQDPPLVVRWPSEREEDLELRGEPVERNGVIVDQTPSSARLDLVDRSPLNGARSLVWLGLLVGLWATVINRPVFGGRSRLIIASVGLSLVTLVATAEWRSTVHAVDSIVAPPGSAIVADWAGWTPLTESAFDGAAVLRLEQPLDDLSDTALKNRLRSAGWQAFGESPEIWVTSPSMATGRAWVEAVTVDLIRIQPRSDDDDDGFSRLVILLGLALVALSVPPYPGETADQE